MADEKKNGKMNGNGGICSCAGMAGCNCQHGCGCGCGGHGRHWTFFLLRTLLTILILMIVFWFGVAAGRLGGFHNLRYGYPPGVYNAGGGSAVPMMRINNGGTTTTPATTGSVQNY